MQANTETARNFSLRPSLPNKLHHQASLLLRTFSCFQSIQLDPLKAIPPFPLTPIPCHTSDPHPLTLGLSLLTLIPRRPSRVPQEMPRVPSACSQPGRRFATKLRSLGWRLRLRSAKTEERPGGA